MDLATRPGRKRWVDPELVVEADQRLAAVEIILCHGAMSADVYSLEEAVDHAIVMIARARRFLAAA